MKDIKTFLIGFLSCACLFLIMGQTDNPSGLTDEEKEKEWISFVESLNKGNMEKEKEEEWEEFKNIFKAIGKFQVSTSISSKGVYETIIDTRTGEIQRNRQLLNSYEKF